jgi:F-type H+-transporting ATPase subunit delta
MSGPAKRYANVLLNQSVQNLALLRQTAEILDALAEAVNETTELRRLLTCPLTPVNAARDIMLKLMPGGENPALRPFVSLLADRRRLALLPDIAAAFKKLLAEAGYMLYVEVASAYPLDDGQYARLGEIYRRRYMARAVDITRIIDASLIGGVRVRAGDFVTDGTIKMKLSLIGS